MKNLAHMLRVQREYLAVLALMKEHPDLLTNVLIYHYDCKVKRVGDTKFIQVKGLCAINTDFHLSAEWQVECHIIKKYNVTDFHKSSNNINPIQIP